MKKLENTQLVSKVDEVITTQRLTALGSRPADFEAEARALSELAEMMAISPTTVLQKLADFIISLCRAESSGITLLEETESGPILRWVVTSGGFASMAGGTMPVDASPCGTVIDRNQAVMMAHPGRFYPAALQLSPHIKEIILAPFLLDGRPIGTVWGLAHENDGFFDAEDMRLLTSLSKFAGAAYTMSTSLTLSQQREAALQNKDEQRVALGRELTHRMKNLLAVVQAITSQTLRHATSIEDAQKTIAARLNAMARAQDVLVQSDWAETTIKEVVDAALSLHDSGRFDVEGDPNVALSDQQGLGLSLGLHELATNAAKYGGLSTDTGRVQISWRKTGDNGFVMEWTEQGGPPVKAPEKTGFGSRLIEKMVAPYFSGEANISYEPDGIRFRLAGKLGSIAH